MTAISYRDNV